jgi:hypothetical protein
MTSQTLDDAWLALATQLFQRRSPRDQQIIRDVSAGVKVSMLAHQHGVSAARIYQIYQTWLIDVCWHGYQDGDSLPPALSPKDMHRVLTITADGQVLRRQEEV